MKLSRTFAAAALLAGLAFASTAHAITLDTTSSNVGIASGSSSSSTSANGTTFYDNTISGSLSALTKDVFTFTATNVSASDYTLLADGALGSNNTLVSLTSPQTSAAVGALPVLTTAGFTGGTLTGKITIANLTASVENFSAYFTALLSQTGGTITVSSVVSAVPLPASVVLFGTALMALAGFGMARKAREQA